MLKLFSNPFSWKNVPKILLVIGIIVSIVTLWAIFDSNMLGNQPFMLPFLIGFTALWWVWIYGAGCKKTLMNPDTEAIDLEGEDAEPPVEPEFQDYLAQAQTVERAQAARKAREDKAAHHYDASV